MSRLTQTDALGGNMVLHLFEELIGRFGRGLWLIRCEYTPALTGVLSESHRLSGLCYAAAE